MVMVGVFVALLAKGDPEPQTPAILLLTDTMSLELELEKRGESVILRAGRMVGGVNVPFRLPTIASVVRSARSAQSASSPDARGAGENPDAVGGGILAGIDVNDQLRLGVVPPPPPPPPAKADDGHK